MSLERYCKAEWIQAGGVSISFGDLMSLEPRNLAVQGYTGFNLLWRSNVIGTQRRDLNNLEQIGFNLLWRSNVIGTVVQEGCNAHEIGFQSPLEI